LADTNNERVGKALALLTQGLAPFVDRECGLVYGMNWENSVRVDAPASKTDVQFLLRTMTSTCAHSSSGVAKTADKQRLARFAALLLPEARGVDELPVEENDR
jgi:hypothetical protein